MTDLARIGVEVDTRQVRTATGDLNKLAAASGGVESATGAMTSALKGAAAAFGLYKLGGLIKDSAMLAARFETMGVVMRIAGNNAGYSMKQMQSYSEALQKSGISMLQSRDALTQLSTANIDLAKAQGLARAAQDLAVVGNINSSEALGRLIAGIKKGETEILQTIGLSVSFESAYKKLASQIGTTSDRLNENQKMQARTNTVLAESVRYAGIYEESMGTAGKAITSLTRYWEDLKVKAGEAFLPALTDAVFKLTDALKAANVELDKAGNTGLIDRIGVGLGGAFKTVFETVAVLGANVAYVFQAIGTEIGGIAAQSAAFLSGDFSKAGAIRDQMKIDAEAARKAVDAFSDSILKQEKATSKATGVSEDARIASGKAASAKAEAEDKALKASEVARKAGEKAKKDYDQVVKSAAEYVKGLKAQEAQIGATKEQIAMMDAATVALTLNTSKERGAVLEAAHSLATKTAAYAAQTEEIERIEKAFADYDESLQRNEKTVNDRVRALDRETAEMQMSDDALRAHLVTLDLEKLGIKAVDTGYEEYRKSLTDAYATNEAARQHKTMWDTIEKTAHDTWTSVWSGGKSAFEKIGATIKSAVLDLLYQMTVKKWIIGVGLTAEAGTAAASGSGVGGLSSLLSTGQSVYSALSGGATSGIASMISSAGSLFGSEALTSFAAGVKGATLGAGLAGPTTAGATGALGAGGAFATALPWIGGALALASIMPKAFGMGPKQPGQTSLVGSLGNQGFSGSYQTPWTQEGGWFRSDKSGTDQSPISGQMAASFAAAVRASEDAFNSLITAAGSSARTVEGWSLSINRQIDTQDQMNALLLEAADSIGAYLVPELKAFQAQGEALTATAVRMRDILRITDGVMKVLGRDTSTAWGKIGVASLEARNELVNLAGGVDNLTSSTTTYYDLFFSDSEKLQKDITAMQELFGSFGQSMPQTKDAFRLMIESIDPSTPTGRATLAGLLNIAPEFAKVADATAAETARLRDDTAKKLIDTFTAKGDLLGRLTAVGDAAEYLRSAATTATTATSGLTGTLSGAASAATTATTATSGLTGTLGGAASAAATATTATGGLTGTLGGAASAATTATTATSGLTGTLGGAAAAANTATTATSGLTGTLGGAAAAANTATTATGSLSGGIDTVGSAASAANDKLFTVSTKLGGTAEDVLKFSNASNDSTSKLTEVSGNLTKEIDKLRGAYDAAVLDIGGLGTALAKVNVETYLQVLTGVFDSFAKRLEQVRDGIKSERIAVREAAIQIIGAPSMSLSALRGGVSTALPGTPSAEALISAQQQAEGPRLNAWFSAQNLASWEAETAKAWSAANIIKEEYGRGGDISLIVQRHLAALAVVSSNEQALAGVREEHQANLKALGDAESKARAETVKYAASMQAYTVAAGNSVTRLSRLREETVKYYEAQKQLAELMKSSASNLRATISDYEFSQLATDQLRAVSLQGQFASAYGAAWQAAQPGGDLNAMAQAATTFNGLLNKYLSLDSTVADKGTYLGQAAEIAAWLEKNQPRNYQSESLGLLSDIDAQLAELDEGTAAASKIISQAVLASGDRTADGLRAVIAAITGQPVPSFASGGIHAGGLRLVGENGPELEMTGPSRILNAGQTRDILGGRNDGSVDELRALRRDIAGLRAEAQATASNTNRMKRYFERWDRGDGMAVVTDDTAPLDVRMVA